jgi:hypothetical protein
MNAKGVAEVLPPIQGYVPRGISFQGLTPLAIDCHRFAVQTMVYATHDIHALRDIRPLPVKRHTAFA